MPWPAGPHPTSRYSLVVAAPREGRYHQIRKHLHHISHPIIGDRQYGDREHNQLFRERIPAGRLMLHARGLRLRHPETGAALRLRAPFPDDWQSVMDQLAPFTTDMGNAEEPAD
jgi:tRNA pseudouridine65 synthase